MRVLMVGDVVGRPGREAAEQLLGMPISQINCLTPEQMVSTPMVGDWTPRDVLAHLAEWQRRWGDAWRLQRLAHD